MAPDIFPPSPRGGAAPEGSVAAVGMDREAFPSIVVDSAGRMLRLSGAARRYLTVPDKALGAQIVPRIRPELSAAVEATLARVFAMGEPFLGPPRRVPVPGGPRHIALHVRPLRGGAVVTGAQVTLLDCGPDGIAGQAPAPEPPGAGSTGIAFHPGVRATAFAVYRMSPDWSEMRVLKGRGFLRGTERPSRRWLDDYIASEDQPLVRETIAKAIRAKSLFELEHPVRRADGSIGWTFSRAVPILDAQGEIVEWFGTASDLTARRRALENLAQARRIEAIGRLAGGLSHDVSNVLTVILANLELAEIRVTDPQTRVLIGRAVEAADLACSYNRRLLSLVGKRRGGHQTVDLRTRIRDMAAILQRALGTQIALSTEIASDLWPVRADPGGIDGVLLNLALNACDAMPAGGRLRMTGRNRSLDAEAAGVIRGGRPGHFACVTVSDSGIGMSPETLAQATEAFFSSKGHKTGAGLGLFSVLGFLREVQGFLELASTSGEGTSVSFYLPRSEAPQTLLPRAQR